MLKTEFFDNFANFYKLFYLFRFCFQTDVVGICETEYMPTRAKDEYQTYQKIKHMDTCRHNQELFQFALNLPDMNVQNLPLMRYTYGTEFILMLHMNLYPRVI